MGTNHKAGLQASRILAMQNADGTWGKMFHTLSQPKKGALLTTEQALRRLKRLGFTIGDPPIQKAVDYMCACLLGERKIDDYWEKTHDWGLFTKLMLSTWIRIFEPDNPIALSFAKRWSTVITKAFESGTYHAGAYFKAYQEEFSSTPKGGREIDFSDFYHLHLLCGVLSKTTEARMIEYILAKPGGIFYVYQKPLNVLPDVFASLETSRYLAAVEILSAYQQSKKKLRYVTDWLEHNKDVNGQWDLGAKARDDIYFPLSDSWRKQENRKADCTERIAALLQSLTFA